MKYGSILSISGIVIFAAACVTDMILRKKRPQTEAEIIPEEEIIPDSEIFENTTDTEENIND